ncbi:S-adenosyl-L-methionine-dependent methyltransferase [Aspergillus pseudotamarii]|uniref:S-adenosyl-L-methionine-dependent methyltransferase n=1 Tax=Aspergillus pseudotamarii TaxID=132259 RepID=A0A5N6SP54_ASPPS|nr:S-adenosyl-L-methionine-dependent methyltransferase [Aspergillus pseudotamarii]KAE8136468.1 S-adenosyl-L-methionine-dependent methyltransferase [Aspergillus pseudotamarii]
MDPLQFNKIGQRYNDVTNLPGLWLVEDILKSQIGVVHGLEVLDLACGTGYWSRKSIDLGAKKVVGVDISKAMVDNARLQTRAQDPSEFHVVDCIAPFNMGTFDLVLGVWLLNYAKNKTELLAMWQNIFHSLKSGGRFVGVIPNYEILQTTACGQEYHFGGVTYKVLERVTEGTRTQVILDTTDPISFFCYMLEPWLHDECAIQAGFDNLRWEPLPSELDVDLGPPFFQIITASCPKS